MKTKKQFKYFTIFNYEKEEDYLQQMHKLGWRLTIVGGFGMYHFEECNPDNVAYRLDYNKEGLANKDEYIKMFSDCGWEYLFDYAGYSYFRKHISADDDTEEIFYDDESKLEMMRRVLKGRMLPMLIIFICVLLPQFIFNIFVQQDYLMAAIIGLAIAIYIAVFAQCAIRYNKLKNNNKK